MKNEHLRIALERLAVLLERVARTADTPAESLGDCHLLSWRPTCGGPTGRLIPRHPNLDEVDVWTRYQ